MLLHSVGNGHLLLELLPTDPAFRRVALALSLTIDDTDVIFVTILATPLTQDQLHAKYLEASRELYASDPGQDELPF